MSGRWEVGHEPSRLNGEDPIAYIRSHNIKRRNLNHGQRALIEMRLAGKNFTNYRELDKETGIKHPQLVNAQVILEHTPPHGL